MKILALDNLQKVGLDVFAKEGFEVDVKGKMTTEELSAVIDNYDGVVVRGATKATAMAFEKVSRLKVIGRAGSGTDNIDKVAATKKGVVVMNTPGGDTVTPGGHAIALLMPLARRLRPAGRPGRAGGPDPVPPPSHARNEEHGVRGLDREDEEGGMHHQLRPRGPDQRAGPPRGARVGPREGGGARTR